MVRRRAGPRPGAAGIYRRILNLHEDAPGVWSGAAPAAAPRFLEAIGKATAFAGALRLSSVTAAMTLDGAMGHAAFLTYAERVLAPTLRPGDFIMMDNLPTLKLLAVRVAIERTGV